jgi:hypothetical protein
VTENESGKRSAPRDFLPVDVLHDRTAHAPPNCYCGRSCDDVDAKDCGGSSSETLDQSSPVELCDIEPMTTAANAKR